MTVPDKYYGEQNLRLSKMLLEKQGEINRLTAQLAAQTEAMQELDDKATEAYETRDAALHELEVVEAIDYAERTRIRRFTVISPGCDGEGVQFSGGLLVVLWGEGNDTIDSYTDLDSYQRKWPHHVITWIDDQPKEDTQGLALRRTYGEDRHIVDLRDRGWTIQHPDGCRPNLFDCPVNKAAERDLVDPPAELGRFTCELGDDGRFEIGDRITDQPKGLQP